MSEKLSVILLICACCLMFCGCAVNPVTGEQQLMLVGPAQELQIGRQYAPEVEKQLGGRIANPSLQNYVSHVGQKIARLSHMPDLKFSYVAVNHKSINAMALPGGYVFITKGMLEQLETEAQLAAILAHETVHVTARHSAQAISNQIGIDILLSAVTSGNTSQSAVSMARMGSQLISMGHSRKHEAQADIIGLDYLDRAGYNANAMLETMEILERQGTVRPIEFLSTHPSPANRRENILEHIRTRGLHTGTRVGQADYSRNVLANLNN